jgi:hypothetical protein
MITSTRRDGASIVHTGTAVTARKDAHEHQGSGLNVPVSSMSRVALGAGKQQCTFVGVTAGETASLFV